MSQQAHQYNLDAAQREIDRRSNDGEDMAGARIHPSTYSIIKPDACYIGAGCKRELVGDTLHWVFPSGAIGPACYY